MKKKLLLVVFFFLALFSMPTKVFAVEDRRGESESNNSADFVTVPLGEKMVLRDGSQVRQVFNSTDDMVNLIVKIVFVAAGLVLFFMIVGAGFALIQGDSKDKDKAKGTMTSAAIGFIVMFSAYWIMQIIQIITGISMGF